MKLEILYKDRDIIVVKKPAFVSSQEERGAGADMVSCIRNYYAIEEEKQVQVFVVHRLDKPVAGVMVYALNKRSAVALSKQLANGDFNKTYYAILKLLEKTPGVLGFNEKKVLTDYLIKDGRSNMSRIAEKGEIKDAKKAVLEYEITDKKDIDGRMLYLAKICLITGRHHQIRVQFSGNGAPLYGDKKYGSLAPVKKSCKKTDTDIIQDSSSNNDENEGIALCAYALRFNHPVTGKTMEFSITPDNSIFGRFFNE